MENNTKVVSKAEVTDRLIANLLSDQEDFKTAKVLLKHGQKDRLLDAMASYPLVDEQFDDSEPELRSALTIWKRISDSLVAIGTEAAIEGIINGFNKEQGENNVKE